MRDKRKCSISSQTGGPFIFYGFSKEPTDVCISGHDFPGRTGQIRIDRNDPITTDTNGCIAAHRILPQMKTGFTFLARWVEWPYDFPKDTTSELDGLKKAMEVVDQIQNGTGATPPLPNQ